MKNVPDFEIFLGTHWSDFPSDWVGVLRGVNPINADGTAIFLNDTRDISDSQAWNSPDVPHLWLFNLHYFDCLNVEGSDKTVEACESLLRRWIAENPPYIGLGWHPYTISLRTVNLVKWLRRNTIHKDEFDVLLLRQALFLRDRCEYHIGGNHLFANAKALVFAGVHLAEPNGGLLKKGLSILHEELDEQFLADGAHYERSPMYHSILLWDLLELYELSAVSHNSDLQQISTRLKTLIKSGLRWIADMTHPEGALVFFNDASNGVAPTLSELYYYADLLGLDCESAWLREGTVTYSESGFSVARLDRSALFINHADIAPSYQPGHAHADTFSFEMSLDQRRIFVNSGISKYGDDLERFYQRSSCSHNTATLEGQSSSEVWSGFRVGRRAKVINFDCLERDHETIFSMSHNGFLTQRIAGEHCRVFSLTLDSLNVRDEIKCVKNASSLVSYWHFHPSISVVTLGRGQYRAQHCGHAEISLVLEVINAECLVSEYEYHPSFGVSVKAYRLSLSCVDSSSPWGLDITWR